MDEAAQERAADVLGLLADRDRLAVAGALAALGPAGSGGLAAHAGVDRRAALETVGQLVAAGLARRVGDDYDLSIDGWRAAAAAATTQPEEPDESIGFGMTADERAVLEQCFEGRSLTRLPRARTKRLVVLERLALEFEPGRRYPETEVNSILGQFDDDWSTLRRALVDEGLLDRDGNQYWRSGGRVLT